MLVIIKVLSLTLTWLCERPRGDFTVGWVLRRGWPGFANVVLLLKQLELGRAVRLIERVIFLGSMAALIYFGSLPVGSLGEVHIINVNFRGMVSN